MHYLATEIFVILDLAGSEVKFDSQGDGLARYDILNYQRVGNTSTYQYKVSRNMVQCHIIMAVLTELAILAR